MIFQISCNFALMVDNNHDDDGDDVWRDGATPLHSPSGQLAEEEAQENLPRCHQNIIDHLGYAQSAWQLTGIKIIFNDDFNILNDQVFDSIQTFTRTPTAGLLPFVATGAEGRKQPSKGSPPLGKIIIIHAWFTRFIIIFITDISIYSGMTKPETHSQPIIPPLLKMHWVRFLMLIHTLCKIFIGKTTCASQRACHGCSNIV